MLQTQPSCPPQGDESRYSHGHICSVSPSSTVTHSQPCPRLFPHPWPGSANTLGSSNHPGSCTWATVQTRSHVCARRHVSRYLHTLPHPCAHGHSPTFVSTQAPYPGILASPSLYPTTALPTGTHVHHTWQRAHIQTLLPPPWLWAPRIRARRAGCSHRQNGSTSAPPPGGRQVQGPRPRPRQAGREGALITRPRGTPPHTPFIPATPDRGPDAHYRLPPGH